MNIFTFSATPPTGNYEAIIDGAKRTGCGDVRNNSPLLLEQGHTMRECSSAVAGTKPEEHDVYQSHQRNCREDKENSLPRMQRVVQ